MSRGNTALLWSSWALLLLFPLIGRSQNSAVTSAIFLDRAFYDTGIGGAGPVAVADVNGDGKPDFVVLQTGAQIWLGNGDGTFQTGQSYPSGGYTPLSIAVADVNGDGKPDLLVGHFCSSPGDCSSGSVGVLLGNGDGTFQAAKNFGSGGYAATSIAVADVNGDGKLDLLVLNFCASDSASCLNSLAAVLLGNGDGTFQGPQIYNSGGRFAHSLAVADVNGDGKPDLLVANQCASGCQAPDHGTISVLLGNGDGTFAEASNYDSGGMDANSIAVDDVNQDGKPDLLIANQCVNGSSNCTLGPGEASVLIGRGDGTFQSAQTYGSGGVNAFFIIDGDVNGDGNPDLLLLNGCAAGPCANGSVLMGNGDGTFQAAVNFDSGSSSGWAALADVDKDGKLDLLTSTNCSANLCQGQVTALLNVISPAATRIAVAASSLINQTVTFTATVSAQNGSLPDGMVAFRLETPNAAQVVNVPLNQQRASFTKTFRTAGTRVITASYLGDQNFQPSGSAQRTQVIPPFVTINASPPPPLTRDSDGNFVALVTITNNGNVSISSAQVTIAGSTLGYSQALAAPPSVNNLAPRASATVRLKFPSTAAPPELLIAPLQVSGTYSAPAGLLGGSWSLGFRTVSLK